MVDCKTFNVVTIGRIAKQKRGKIINGFKIFLYTFCQFFLCISALMRASNMMLVWLIISDVVKTAPYIIMHLRTNLNFL